MAWNYKAVKYTNTKDTITATMICSCGKDMSGKVVTKSWKNYCPGCKKSGVLVGHAPPKHNLTEWKGKNAPEGEITCKSCGYDACGVHGRGKDSKTRNMLLKPAGGVNSKTASSSSVQAAKCEVSKAQARKKTKATLKANSKPLFKATLTSPMLKNLRADTFCGLDKKVFPHIPKEQLYINQVKVDVDNQKMTLDLLEEMPPPSTEYKDSEGNSNISSSYADGIEKTLKLKGKELKTFDKIFQYARVGGKYKMQYAYYYDHKKGGSFDKFHAASAKYCWENKVANCCDLTWIIRKMCEGAGVSCGVIYGEAYFPKQGKTIGHLWNTYKGKRKDATSRTATNYKVKRVIIKG